MTPSVHVYLGWICTINTQILHRPLTTARKELNGLSVDDVSVDDLDDLSENELDDPSVDELDDISVDDLDDMM